MNSKNKLETQPLVYSQFRYLYANYDKFDASQLNSVYKNDIYFLDPLHAIEGLDALKNYFAGMNKNLVACNFEFIDEFLVENMAHITWVMHFQHKKINNGQMCSLRGMTFIRFDKEGIFYHEDCYDLGAMVYENLPVIGKMIRVIKSKIGKG